MAKHRARGDGLSGAAAQSLQGSGRTREVDITGTAGSRAGEIKVMEVDAFSSVHDMIHAAINSYGVQATLRQVYEACQLHGRIAYKRAGGSRLITNNEHWKSQIRHALYTCDRFRRDADNPELWTITSDYQSLRPLIVKVLVRNDSNADSICDEDAQKAAIKALPSKLPRRAVREKLSADDGNPFPAVNLKKRRSSRESIAVAAQQIVPHCTTPTPRPQEFIDECSHIDHSPNATCTQHQGLCNTPVSTQRDYSLTPSPVARPLYFDSSAWQRAAVQLNSTHLGSNGGSPFVCERSAEAESPGACQPLYALRSHSKPPPGFGANPDPIAEQAAREAHARTIGPLKKRLKAAAKAAEMAASTGNEEATSIHQGSANFWKTPSPLLTLAEASLAQHHAFPFGPSSCLSGSPYFTRSNGQMDLERRPSSGAQTCGNSCAEAFTHVSSQAQPVAAYSPPVQPRRQAKPPGEHIQAKRGTLCCLDCDTEEGADETDEGGGKRLLRSHTAAAAADLDRENSVHYTMGSI